MASRYWVGGGASTNWSATGSTNWSASSGGANNAAVPANGDDVFFDANSGTGGCAVDVGTNTLNSLNMTGLSSSFNFSGSHVINVGPASGTTTVLLNGTWTSFTSSLSLKPSTGATINFTSNGNSICVNDNPGTYGGTISQQDNLTTAGNYSNNGFTISAGSTWNTNSHNITHNSNSGSFGPWNNNGTFTAGTGTVTLQPSGTNYNLKISGTADSNFYNLTVSGGNRISAQFMLSSNQTVTNTLTLSGYNSTTSRLLVTSDTLGTQRKLTVPSTATATYSNVDFQDIDLYCASGQIDLTTITGLSGDCGGNNATDMKLTPGLTNSITFINSGTNYWSHISSETSVTWSLGRNPLPQDDVTCNLAFSSNTLYIDVPRPCRNIDFSQSSGTLTIQSLGNPSSGAGTPNPNFFGAVSMKNIGDHITITGNWGFYGRGSYTMVFPAATNNSQYQFVGFGGSYTLGSNCTATGNTTAATCASFNDGGYAFSFRGGNFNCTSSITATGTWTLTSVSGTFLINAPTLNTSSLTINIPDASSTAKTFNGSGGTYKSLIISGAGTGSYTIQGNNTFTNFVDINTAAHSLIFTAGTTNTASNFMIQGADNTHLITINSTSSSPFTLSQASGVVNGKNLSIQHSTATGGASWYAGTGSTDGGGNTGWTFSDAPAATALILVGPPSGYVKSASPNFIMQPNGAVSGSLSTTMTTTGTGSFSANPSWSSTSTPQTFTYTPSHYTAAFDTISCTNTGSLTNPSVNYTTNKIPITVTANANAKRFDGTTTCAKIPSITQGTLSGSDTANFTEAYAASTAGSQLTIVPSGTVTDGNSGNDYAYTFVNSTSGVILPYRATPTIPSMAWPIFSDWYNPKFGAVTKVTVTAGGSGYTSAPTVTINDSTGSGATAFAVVSGGAVIGVFLMTSGSNYSSGATASFSGGGGSSATATVTTNTGVIGVLMTAGGSAYGAAPSVTFSAPGGGGTTATGTAILGNGVSSITVGGGGGSGYTQAPTVVISGGGTNAMGAIARANISGGKITSFTMLSYGAGYTSTPTVTLYGGNGTGASGTAVVTNNMVVGVTMTNNGKGYAPSDLPITVTFGSGAAAATASIGTMGDGVTDDTTALQVAWNTVNGTWLSYPTATKSLFLSSGTYLVSNTLGWVGDVTGHQRNYGANVFGRGSQTVLKWNGSYSGTMITFQGNGYTKYQGFVLDGNNSAAVGIDTGSPAFQSSLYFAHVAFQNFTSAGLFLDNPAGQATADSVVWNYQFNNCATGAALYGYNTLDIVFDHGDVRNCTKGFSTTNGEYYVRNTHFELNTYDNYYNNAISGNSIRSCTSEGSSQFLVINSGSGSATLQDCWVDSWIGDPSIPIANTSSLPMFLFDVLFTNPPNTNPPLKQYTGKTLTQNCVSAATSSVLSVLGGTNYACPYNSGTEPGGVVIAQSSPNYSSFASSITLPSYVFDVTFFGADPTGVADSTTAFNNAIAAAKAYGTGAVVYIPIGSYKITSTLHITGGNFQIWGGGWQTHLNWSGGSSNFIWLDSTSNVTLGNIYFYSGSPTYDIYVSGTTTNLILDYVWVAGKGLYLDTLPTTSKVNIRYFGGPVYMHDCGSAQVLEKFFENANVIDGTSAATVGNLGCLTFDGGGASAISNVLWNIQDGQSFVCGDFYVESVAANWTMVQTSGGKSNTQVTLECKKAEVNFGVSSSSITITNGGSGYSNSFAVTFSGGSGTQATGTATAVGGVVQSVTVATPGSYTTTTTPTIDFSAGGGTSAAATVAFTQVPMVSTTNSTSYAPQISVLTPTGSAGQDAWNLTNSGSGSITFLSELGVYTSTSAFNYSGTVTETYIGNSGNSTVNTDSTWNSTSQGQTALALDHLRLLRQLDYAMPEPGTPASLASAPPLILPSDGVTNLGCIFIAG